MPPVLTALRTFVVSLFQSRQALRLQILALQHQVSVYKRIVPRPRLRPSNRLFWSWLSCLWSGWQGALQFVQPRTVIAWQRKRFQEHWRRLRQRGKPGRPTIAQDVRDLIRAMWQAHPTWGSPRIVGELRKLGINVAKPSLKWEGFTIIMNDGQPKRMEASGSASGPPSVLGARCDCMR